MDLCVLKILKNLVFIIGESNPPHFGECLLFVLQVQLWFCGVLASVLLSECFDNDFDEIPDGLIQPFVIEDTHIQSLVPVM